MDDTTPADRPEPPDRRASRRPRDLVISLLVLLVPVVLLVGGYQLLSGRNQPVAVDPAPALADARAEGLDAVEPTGLGGDWVLVSAVFRREDGGAVLRLGYATPGGASVQLVQSTVPAERLLPEVLPDPATPGGTVDVAGETWQRYQTGSGGRALVLLQPEQTTIAFGAASEAELHTLAAAVR